MQGFRMNRSFPAQRADSIPRSVSPSRYRMVYRLLILCGLLAFGLEPSHGQEATRLSLAGAAAAEANHQAAATIGYYNLRLGDLALRFTSGTGVAYNDNIHLSSSHPEGDVILTPNLNMAIHLPVTQNNSLDLTVGAGYSIYTTHSDMNQFFINPGSGLFYNIYVGDFVINLHERVSITENGYQNPTVNGGGNNASLNNTVGVGVTWDLNQVVLSAGYDHGNYMSLGSGLRAPDSATDNLFLSAGVHVRPELTVGVEAGGSSVTYSQSGGTAYPDTKQWSVGGFGRWQVSQYINTELHAGYTELLPGNTTSTNLSTAPSGGLYFGFSLSHRVNEWLDYTFSADRSQDLQNYGQPYTTDTVRLTPNWKFIHDYTFSTPFWWTHGTQFYFQANTYDQYGGGLNVGRQITEKLSSSLSYQYIQETSDQAGLNYTVNIISLNFAYRF